MLNVALWGDGSSVMAYKTANNHIHSDCQKLRRFAMQLLAAGDVRRYISVGDVDG